MDKKALELLKVQWNKVQPVKIAGTSKNTEKRSFVRTNHITLYFENNVDPLTVVRYSNAKNDMLTLIDEIERLSLALAEAESK